MIDNKNHNLNDIVDSLASLYNIYDPRVIESVTGDIETYINDDHDDIECFDSIPITEFAYAFASNLMQYGDNTAALRLLWEHAGVELAGLITGESVSAIDWNQAVDDEGRAIYDAYYLTMATAPKSDSVPSYETLTFSPADVERFARTW